MLILVSVLPPLLSQCFSQSNLSNIQGTMPEISPKGSGLPPERRVIIFDHGIHKNINMLCCFSRTGTNACFVHGGGNNSRLNVKELGNH